MSIFPSLSKTFIQQSLPYDTLVNGLRNAFIKFWRSKSPGQELTVQQPLRTVLTNGDRSGLLASMPAYLQDEGFFSVKLVTIFNENRDLPSHQGVILLFDASTGTPVFSMDAEEVTARRTAAASALSSLYLASNNASTLAVLGAGVQGETHVDAHLSVMKQLKRVHVWNRTRSRAERLVAQMRQRWGDVTFQVSDSVKEAVSEADIVCTVTSSVSPILDGDWMRKPGVHVVSVGAPIPTAREMETNVLIGSLLVADSTESAEKESGDVITSGKAVDAELGQLIAGDVEIDREKRTVFKSLGIAMEDLVGAKMVFEAFKKIGDE